MSVSFNHANTKIIIEVANGLDTGIYLEVYDLSGEKDTSEMYKTSNIVLDVSDFPEGIYLILCKTEDYTCRQKVIVKH